MKESFPLQYEFASHVEDLLHQSNSSHPKFLYMAFQSVHGPLQVPDHYRELYLDVKDNGRQIHLGEFSKGQNIFL